MISEFVLNRRRRYDALGVFEEEEIRLPVVLAHETTAHGSGSSGKDENRTFALALATLFLMCDDANRTCRGVYGCALLNFMRRSGTLNAMRPILDAIRTRTAKNDYDPFGDDRREHEGHRRRFTRLLSDPLDPDSLPIVASVVSKSYYDGTKTYELTEPIDAWPIEEFDLSEYEEYRRRGARATISNRNKLWRFWYSCPIPRYFMIPSERNPYACTMGHPHIIKRTRSDRGDNLIQLDSKRRCCRHMIPIFCLGFYISLNIDKIGSGYQLSVT